MNCPVCASVLKEKELEPFLTVKQCPSCLGLWIPSANYLVWVQLRPGGSLRPLNLNGSQNSSTEEAVEDKPRRAKLCLDCGKIMYPFRIGYGIPFRIDCCSKCTSIWLGFDEWGALKEQNLHDRLHVICGESWQAELRRQDSVAIRESILRDKLSPEDRDRVEQTKLWLQGHPHRNLIVSLLLDQEEK